MKFVWEAFSILIIAIVLIRTAGKKTASEMTGLEMITLISIASIMGHAVSEQEWWKTVTVMCIFVVTLIAVQYLCLRFDFIERMVVGKSVVVIRDGKIVAENLKKLRMTVDQLEARLREKGIDSIDDVKTGTIEMSGVFGCELKRHAKPLTIGELEKIIRLPKEGVHKGQANLFDEVVNREHHHSISPKSD